MTEVEFNDTHERVFALLPWYVNQTLDPEEDSLVEEHLKQCLICRNELALLQSTQSAIANEEEVNASMQRSLDILQARISSEQSNDTSSELHFDRNKISFLSRAKAAIKESHKGVQITLFAQAAALVLAIALFWTGKDSGTSDEQLVTYTTLTTSPSLANTPSQKNASQLADLKVIFEKDISVQALSDLLATHELEIVKGPSAAGAFQLKSITHRDDWPQLISLLSEENNIAFIQKVE